MEGNVHYKINAMAQGAIINRRERSGKMGETSQGSSYFREDFPWSSDRRKMVPRTEIAHTIVSWRIQLSGADRALFYSAYARHSAALDRQWNWFENLIFIDLPIRISGGGKKFIDWRQLKVFADGTTDGDRKHKTLTRWRCHAVMRRHEGTEFCSMIWRHE